MSNAVIAFALAWILIGTLCWLIVDYSLRKDDIPYGDFPAFPLPLLRTAFYFSMVLFWITAFDCVVDTLVCEILYELTPKGDRE